MKPLCVLGVLCLLGVARVSAQEPAAPQPVSAAQLKAAIDKLGNLDYATRTDASRTVRRTPAAQAVPALAETVSNHADGYVRYRALVLMTGFNDPRTKDSMREVLASPNDRLRAVAYSFFERNPDPSMLPQLLAALDKEVGEFVRPALVRSLAAYSADARARQALLREVGRWEDFFRSAVIEALGDHRATYASVGRGHEQALRDPRCEGCGERATQTEPRGGATSGIQSIAEARQAASTVFFSANPRFSERLTRWRRYH